MAQCEKRERFQFVFILGVDPPVLGAGRCCERIEVRSFQLLDWLQIRTFVSDLCLSASYINRCLQYRPLQHRGPLCFLHSSLALRPIDNTPPYLSPLHALSTHRAATREWAPRSGGARLNSPHSLP